MKISSSAGSYSCPSFEEYESCLKACFASEAGSEIWCALEAGGYPCLSILADGRQAVVNWFAEEGGDMAASLGDEEAAGVVSFCGGQYETAAYQVISTDDAMKCALAFFHTQDCPDCIDWEEL
ncbi:Imm1 family immunity protein [Oscillospiraceae bacterium 50-60]